MLQVTEGLLIHRVLLILSRDLNEMNYWGELRWKEYMEAVKIQKNFYLFL